MAANIVRKGEKNVTSIYTIRKQEFLTNFLKTFERKKTSEIKKFSYLSTLKNWRRNPKQDIFFLRLIFLTK